MSSCSKFLSRLIFLILKIFILHHTKRTPNKSATAEATKLTLPLSYPQLWNDFFSTLAAGHECFLKTSEPILQMQSCKHSTSKQQFGSTETPIPRNHSEPQHGGYPSGYGVTSHFTPTRIEAFHSPLAKTWQLKLDKEFLCSHLVFPQTYWLFSTNNNMQNWLH